MNRPRRVEHFRVYCSRAATAFRKPLQQPVEKPGFRCITPAAGPASLQNTDKFREPFFHGLLAHIFHKRNSESFVTC